MIIILTKIISRCKEKQASKREIVRVGKEEKTGGGGGGGRLNCNSFTEIDLKKQPKT